MDRDEALIARVGAGDRTALEELVTGARDQVYNLALRMLGNPADAEDVSQEILIRVVNALPTFRGESSFRTWVYRIATNQLLTTRRRQAEEKTDSFDVVAAHLDGGLAAALPPLDDQLLVSEAKLVCTSRMLLCLDREHRVAFILGEILDLSSEDGAEVLEITLEAFRKRLSRARERMEEFMTQRCGLVDELNACRCAVQAAAAVRAGILDSKTVRLSNHETCAGPGSRRRLHVEQLTTWERALEVLRSHPAYAAPTSMTESLKKLLASDKSGLLA